MRDNLHFTITIKKKCAWSYIKILTLDILTSRVDSTRIVKKSSSFRVELELWNRVFESSQNSEIKYWSRVWTLKSNFDSTIILFFRYSYRLQFWFVRNVRDNFKTFTSIKEIEQLTRENSYLRQKLVYYQKMHEANMWLTKKIKNTLKKLRRTIFNYKNTQRKIDI